MELLLITMRWPHAEVTEFLDEEIRYLAEHFNTITVAPLRPRGPLTAQLPAGVVVDHSLADHLVHSHHFPSRSSRILTAAGRAIPPSPWGFGFSRGDLVRDGMQRSWIRRALLGRADSRSVSLWASSRQAPSIAYTFWLGAATVGLRQAWPTVRLVSRVHGGDLFAEAHHWSSIPFQEAALNSADLVASVSENGHAYLASKFPDMTHRLAWRRLGIPDLGGLAIPSRRAAIRMISASSIDANKRVLLIAEVALWLARSGHAVEWTHLGDGRGRAGVEQAMANRPETLVVNLRGHVPLVEAHREMRLGEHDVFVNLSLSEGAPVSLMEAQCVGLPVVATAVGGTPEVVPRQWNELVSPTAGVRDIAESVLRAAARPDQQRDERRRFWSQNYDADATYSAWASELRRLASEGRTDA